MLFGFARFVRLIFAFALVAGGLTLTFAAESPSAARRRPNILFLLTDDQRADTIHALGNPVIQTPTLDRLARSGLVFRNCYCMGSDMPAVCFPSRSMLFKRPLALSPEAQTGRIRRPLRGQFSEDAA